MCWAFIYRLVDDKRAYWISSFLLDFLVDCRINNTINSFWTTHNMKQIQEKNHFKISVIVFRLLGNACPLISHSTICAIQHHLTLPTVRSIRYLFLLLYIHICSYFDYKMNCVHCFNRIRRCIYNARTCNCFIVMDI